jgi:hypothetical protein
MATIRTAIIHMAMVTDFIIINLSMGGTGHILGIIMDTDGKKTNIE